MAVFAFDLDSTITLEEMFPRLAREVGQGEAMRRLTDDVLAGRVPLEDSLRMRVELLAGIPLPAVHAALAAVPLDPAITAFIREHRERCAVITANLDIWIEPLMRRLDCRVFSSHAAWEGNRVRLRSVVDKGTAAKIWKGGDVLAAVGDSAADLPMFRVAEYRFAHAGVHMPPPMLCEAATRVTPDGATLCACLRDLC